MRERERENVFVTVMGVFQSHNHSVCVCVRERVFATVMGVFQCHNHSVCVCVCERERESVCLQL